MRDVPNKNISFTVYKRRGGSVGPLEIGIEDKKKEKPELRSTRTSRWRGNGHTGRTLPSEEYLGCSKDGELVNAGRSEDERF
jgi:hypothetical protein